MRGFHGSRQMPGGEPQAPAAGGQHHATLQLHYLMIQLSTLRKALLPPEPPLTHLTPPPSEILPFLSCLHTHSTQLHYHPSPPHPGDPSFPPPTSHRRSARQFVLLPAVLFFHPPHTHRDRYTKLFPNIYKEIRFEPS